MHIKMYLVEAVGKPVAPVVPDPMRTLASTAQNTGIEARGFYLYLPPCPIKARFAMLEEDTTTFYEVDAETERLGNPATWVDRGLSHDVLGAELAIVIPVTLKAARKEELRQSGYNPDFEVGRLVAISRTQGSEIHGRVLGKVNVNPSKYMSWPGLKDKKGPVLPDEIRNGLLKTLWADRMPYQRQVHPQILAAMPRQWHVDPVVLSHELDDIFASGKAISQGEVRWVVDGL